MSINVACLTPRYAGRKSIPIFLRTSRERVKLRRFRVFAGRRTIMGIAKLTDRRTNWADKTTPARVDLAMPSPDLHGPALQSSHQDGTLNRLGSLDAFLRNVGE